MQRKTLTFAFMDPPRGSPRTAIAMRLIELAVRRGHDVNVFAYKGEPGQAAELHAAQPAHAAAGDELSHDWINALMHQATAKGVKVDWVACTHEAESGDAVLGMRRGSHADFWDMAANSHNMLVVPAASDA
jgi:tRNA 2-thiouridine synthesizing protein D